jgi:transposase
VGARQALGGILFVLRTGIGWQELTAEMGFGSGTGAPWAACWRRLRDWQRAGIWAELDRRTLGQLGAAGKIDWSRARVDGGSVAAKRGPGNGAEPDGPGQTGHQAAPDR